MPFKKITKPNTLYEYNTPLCGSHIKQTMPPLPFAKRTHTMMWWVGA